MHCLFKEHKTHQNEIEIDIPLFTLFVHGSMGCCRTFSINRYKLLGGNRLYLPVCIFFKISKLFLHQGRCNIFFFYKTRSFYY